MNSQRAFETLLAGVEAALEESWTRHKAATQQGDFDAMEIELERQKNLVSTRQQLEGLQELWPRLVGKRKPIKKRKRTRQRVARRKKLQRGQKTPEQAFMVPILQVLQDMGGSGSAAEVLDRVGQRMLGTLNEFDLSTLKSGQVRWRNTTQWARQKMKARGLLAADSPRGIWEMTERGRAYLREHAEGLPKPKIPPHVKEDARPTTALEEIPIFARYKGRRFEAVLLPNHHVHFAGQEHRSPSGAARSITGRQVNGWMFWRYADEKGHEHPIDSLR